MVYSKERLDHALRVFRESNVHQSKNSSESNQSVDHLPSKYSFRKVFQPGVLCQADVWDEDEGSTDENFEPFSAKRRSQISTQGKIKRSRTKRQERTLGTTNIANNDVAPEPRGAAIIPTFVRLTFQSQRARTKLQELAKIYGTGAHWPIETLDNCSPCSSNPLATDRLNLPPLTASQASAEFRIIEQHYEKQEAESFEQGFSGRKLRSRMIRLSPSPQINLTCEICKSDPRSLTGSKQGCSCDHLEREYLKPVPKAGDAGFKQEASLENEGQILSNSQPPISGIGSEKPHTTPLQDEGLTAETAIILNTPPETPKSVVATLPCNLRKTIITKWTYPIDFLFMPSANPLQPNRFSRPCHFCNDFRYGIYGCGRTRVQLAYIVERGVFDEISGGNKARGCEPTRMCGLCALEFLHTSKCPEHRLVPLSGRKDVPSLNLQQWMANLSDRSLHRNRRLTYPCCSFCPSPALFRCCAPQKNLSVKGPWKAGHESTRTKCKLFVCLGCKSVSEEYGWDRAKLELAIEARQLVPRADMEFLFPGSDLHTAWGVG